ncbi:hypothetical protein [Amycolatopsis tolypomycina]|uniref:hypothetical protein n=1 Tax=Amycolatopsis tolypomycina TaxID=208445 RepID=UPI0033AF3EE6
MTTSSPEKNDARWHHLGSRGRELLLDAAAALPSVLWCAAYTVGARLKSIPEIVECSRLTGMRIESRCDGGFAVHAVLLTKEGNA